jgi:hypothetical protein
VLADQTQPPPAAPTQAPTPLAPTGTYNTHVCPDPLPPPFSWTALAGATSYDILYQNLTKGRTHLQRTGSNATSRQPPFMFYTGDRYQWQVRAVNTGGEGPWSTPLGFVGQEGSTRQGCVISGTAQVSYF